MCLRRAVYTELGAVSCVNFTRTAYKTVISLITTIYLDDKNDYSSRHSTNTEGENKKILLLYRIKRFRYYIFYSMSPSDRIWSRSVSSKCQSIKSYTRELNDIALFGVAIRVYFFVLTPHPYHKISEIPVVKSKMFLLCLTSSVFRFGETSYEKQKTHSKVLHHYGLYNEDRSDKLFTN